jgi:hypothetical protein
MKSITIELPTESEHRLLERLSHLREKNRRYKLQLKQLQRAHFINKTLLRNYETTQVLRLEQLEAEIDHLRFENERLEQENTELILAAEYDDRQLPLTFSPNGMRVI